MIAVNAEGESEPLSAADGFITENPFGPPSGTYIDEKRKNIRLKGRRG